MPILIRPVREQLEHDRVIRALQAKLKRKFEVQINVGEEKNASVKIGPLILFPDLVLLSLAPPRRLQGLVEVETGESVNNLEALAQWANFARVKAPFQLYVPVGSYDIARRLCEEHQIVPAEVWTFIQLGEQIRFTLAQKNASTEPPKVEKPARPEKPVKAAPAAKLAKAEKSKAEKSRAEKGKAEKGRPEKAPRATRPGAAAKVSKAPARRPVAKKSAPARPAARKAAKGKPAARTRPAAARSARRR